MDYVEQIIQMSIEYAPKIAGAILVLLIGFWVAGWLSRLIYKRMAKNDMDEAVKAFLRNLIGVLLKVLVVISAAGIVGVETTSFVAVLAAAGFAIGLALQGSLGNFAAGVLILLFKPYKVGDFIAAQGHSGTVQEIQIFNTILTALDNRIIIIPNGIVISAPIENITANPERQLDMTFGIGYGDDIDKAKTILENEIKNCPGFLEDNGYKIMVKELADSSVNFAVRFWTKTEDYWTAFFHMQEYVKKSFDREGVSIPFPQMDVHLPSNN